MSIEPGTFRFNTLLSELVRHVLFDTSLNCLLFLHHLNLALISFMEILYLPSNRCLCSSERRASDPSGRDLGFNNHWSNILLRVFFVFHVVIPISSLLPFSVTLWKPWMNDFQWNMSVPSTQHIHHKNICNGQNPMTSIFKFDLGWGCNCTLKMKFLALVVQKL